MKIMMDETGLILPEFKPGEVWLVGSGPGDPGLLTLHAVHAISKADYILYDALVDKACLSFARPEAVLEFAGKRAGVPSPSQQQITNRLIELAHNNRRVLRLKGGDPFIFGRGGEEAQAMRANAIAFRIIPGITAGIAAPAYVGMPLTSRAINQSVTFITGHDANAALPDFDWEALARGAPILVIYMALKQIGMICHKLIEAGRKPDEPLAFISNATLPTQQLVITSLNQAEQTVREQQISAPCLIVIGKAVDIAADLSPWLLNMAE